MKNIGGVKAENGVSSKPSEEVKAGPEMVDFETFSKLDFRVVKILACEAVLFLLHPILPRCHSILLFKRLDKMAAVTKSCLLADIS